MKSLLIETTGIWSWWIGALVLFGLEILAPGTFFIWLGFAATVVGGITLVFGLDNPIWPWQAQWIAFAALSIVFAVYGKRYIKRRDLDKSDHEDLNDRGSQLIGRSGVISEAISGGAGRMRIGETTWRVIGPDIAKGEKAKVTAADGATLTVEPAE